jgi:hypothetical protein
MKVFISLKYLMIILLLLCGNSKKVQECDSEAVLTGMVQAIIDVPKFQDYFRVQETLKQSDFIIIKSPLFHENISVEKLGRKVQFLDKRVASELGLKCYLTFDHLEIKGDTLRVQLGYEIQGAYFYATMIRNQCSWTVLDSVVEETK